MYDDALKREKATHLFSKGSMIGLSEKLLQFVEYMQTKNERH